MKPSRTRLCGLDTVILEPSSGVPEVNVVLCHGFGAPGGDLVALGPELVQDHPSLAAKVRWVFPAAPLSLEEVGMASGRAWWRLDLERLVIGRDWSRYAEEVPEGLQSTRRTMLRFLEELRAHTGVPFGRTVLGGFSQGAMLCTDLALRLEEPPLGLCILSGALICSSEWEERAPARVGLPVFQSHGLQDPLLPYEIAAKLRALLEGAKLDLSFFPFQGEHGIPLPVLQALGSWLQARLPA